MTRLKEVLRADDRATKRTACESVGQRVNALRRGVGCVGRALCGVRCGVNSRRAAAVGFQRSSILRSDLNGQRHGGKLFGVQNLKQKCLTAFSPAADGAEGRCCT